MRQRIASATLTLACLLLSGGLAAVPPSTFVDRLGVDDAVLEVAGSRLYDADAVRRFYARRDYRPVWPGPDCQSGFAQVQQAIEIATSHGLDPDDYHRQALRAPDRCEGEHELLAIDAWLALAAHLHGGRLDPATLEPDWSATRPSFDQAARLEAALADGELVTALQQVAPQQPFYAAMRDALVQARASLAAGDGTAVDAGPLLRLGDTGPRVVQLRERLQRDGGLPQTTDNAEGPFDAALDQAVRAFQRSASLEPDGVVGPRTLQQLNRTAQDQVDQLRVNLERWRWLPVDLGERHIRVNTAEFRLQARDHGVVEREHDVIVGLTFRQTPSLSAGMTHVVLSPWWEVPRRLAVLDKLPLFRRDPAAIERGGYEFVDGDGHVVDPAGIDLERLGRNNFPYRLRQRPGAQNALGKVKLIFPNAHDVYLHDTPTQQLFTRVQRDFSSGCIRTSDALALAEWALAETPGWNRARIEAAAAGGRETVARLADPIPVHLYYLTVAETAGGGVRLLADLYDRDPAVLAALDATSSPVLSAGEVR